MHKICKLLPYIIFEKLVTESYSTDAYINSEKGFKGESAKGLEVKLWEPFPGVFLCKTELALLVAQRDTIQCKLEKVNNRISVIESDGE